MADHRIQIAGHRRTRPHSLPSLSCYRCRGVLYRRTCTHLLRPAADLPHRLTVITRLSNALLNDHSRSTDNAAAALHPRNSPPPPAHTPPANTPTPHTSPPAHTPLPPAPAPPSPAERICVHC